MPDVGGMQQCGQGFSFLQHPQQRCASPIPQQMQTPPNFYQDEAHFPLVDVVLECHSRDEKWGISLGSTDTDFVRVQGAVDRAGVASRPLECMPANLVFLRRPKRGG